MPPAHQPLSFRATHFSIHPSPAGGPARKRAPILATGRAADRRRHHLPARCTTAASSILVCSQDNTQTPPAHDVLLGSQRLICPTALSLWADEAILLQHPPIAPSPTPPRYARQGTHCRAHDRLAPFGQLAAVRALQRAMGVFSGRPRLIAAIDLAGGASEDSLGHFVGDLERSGSSRNIPRTSVESPLMASPCPGHPHVDR